MEVAGTRRGPGEQAEFEVLGRTPTARLVPAFQGSLKSHETPARIGYRAIQPHGTNRGAGTPFSPKPSKTRESVRFLRRAKKATDLMRHAVLATGRIRSSHSWSG